LSGPPEMNINRRRFLAVLMVALIVVTGGVAWYFAQKLVGPPTTGPTRSETTTRRVQLHLLAKTAIVTIDYPSTARFNLTITNVGEVTAHDLRLLQTFPYGWFPLSASIEFQGITRKPTWSSVDTAISWQIADALKAGENLQSIFEVTALEDCANGTVKNQCLASVDQASFRSNEEAVSLNARMRPIILEIDESTALAPHSSRSRQNYQILKQRLGFEHGGDSQPILDLKMLFYATLPSDMDKMNMGGIQDYLETLQVAKKEVPWKQKARETYVHYVLPIRLSAFRGGGGIENWRTPLFKTAREIVGQWTNQYEVAKKIAAWVSKSLRYSLDREAMTTGENSVLWVAENKRGGCGAYATLFVALCRSIDIPAREAYWGRSLSLTARTQGTGDGSNDLVVTVRKDWLIKRYWKEIQVTIVDTTTGATLKETDFRWEILSHTDISEDYNSFVVTIPTSIAKSHSFTITVNYLSLGGHRFAEAYIEERGWIGVESTGGTYDVQTLDSSIFVLSAYNPAIDSMESVYFHYKFLEAIQAFRQLAEQQIGNVAGGGVATIMDQASLLCSTSTALAKQMSFSQKKEMGERIFHLLGKAVLLNRLLTSRVDSLCVWELSDKASMEQFTKVVQEKPGAILLVVPYNTFDNLAQTESLDSGAYVARAELAGMQGFLRSSFRSGQVFVLYIGWNPHTGQWKVIGPDQIA